MGNEIESLDLVLTGIKESTGINCLTELTAIAPRPKKRDDPPVKTHSLAAPVVPLPGLRDCMNLSVLDGVGFDIEDEVKEKQLIIPITSKTQMKLKPWTRKEDFYSPAGGQSDLVHSTFMELYDVNGGRVSYVE
jgi:hypothetical protein